MDKRKKYKEKLFFTEVAEYYFMIKSSRKYLLIIGVILILALLHPYIKYVNFEPIPDERCRSTVLEKNGHVINAVNNSYFVKDFLVSKKGDNYRLNVSLKLKSDAANLVKDYDQEVNIAESRKLKDINIILFLANQFGDRQEISRLSLTPNNKLVVKEINYTTDNTYNNLIIERQDSGEIQEVGIVDLGNSLLLNGAAVPTVVGATDFSQAQVANNINDSQELIHVWGGSEFSGQTFTAGDQYMSGVMLNMNFLNRGGKGDYQLELRKLNGEKISDGVIATYQFNAESSFCNNWVRGNYYFYPLSHQLEVGQKYVIGISALNVESNFMNHLILFGSKGDTYAGGNAVVKKGKRNIVKNGDLDFTIFSAEYETKDNVRVLNKAVIDPIDGRSAVFKYESQNSQRDILDLFSLNINSAVKNEFGLPIESVMYSEQANSIIAPAKDDNHFIYQFDTIHPFQKMLLSAEQPNGYTKSELEYTFDLTRNKWISMPYDSEKKNFNSTIVGDNINHQIFIKVSYQKSNEKVEKNKFFGIKNFKAVGIINL